MSGVVIVVVPLRVGTFAHAQDDAPPLLQVFVTPGEPAPEGGAAAPDVVAFVDILTGETVTEAAVSGERYTIAGGVVLYFDRTSGGVSVIDSSGDVRPHPFITPTPDTRRLDWVVSRDNRLIAWTRTAANPDNTLTTVTTVANIDGSEQREVLRDGPRQGIRAVPAAFSADDAYLYMDYQPDGIGDFTPYTEYAGLFEISLKADNATGNLPGEPGCYCGAGFGGGYLVRMALADAPGGFDLRVVDLAAAVERRIDALPLANYTQGGDVLVSPDGARAIYALAQVQNFGASSQVVQTVFVLADLTAMTQRQLTQPQTLYIRPLMWTENNSAVIFTSPTRPGTWKMNVETGRLAQVASATLIGELWR